MGLLKHAVLGITVAVAIVLCILPPGNRIIYHYYSAVWPPARAGKLAVLAESVPMVFAINTAVKLDVFNTIYDLGGATADEVAKALKLDPRGTEILLNALVAGDILQSPDGKKYELTATADHHLLQRRGSNYLGFFFNFLNTDMQLQFFLNLDKAVRNGGCQLENPADHVKHPFWLDFATVTREQTMEPARFLTTTVDNWAKGKSELKILDVAAGSGGYGYTFAKTYSNSKVDFTDGPGVLEKTKANAEFFGIPQAESSRFNYIPGDIFVDKIAEPESYDIIIVSHLYHHFNKSECTKLTKKLASYLKLDGRLVINEFITDNFPTISENSFPRVFSLMMLANTRYGQAYSVDEYHEFFRAAGLRYGPVAPHPYAPNTAAVGIKI